MVHLSLTVVCMIVVLQLTYINCHVCDPPATFPIGNQIFHLVNQSRPWLSARAYCVALGADLAEPKDLNTLAALVTYLEDNGYKGPGNWFWLGGSDSVNEDDWRWINGDVMARGLSNGWNLGQPNNHKGIEDCLAMYAKTGPNAKHDAPCTDARPFICQRP